MIRAAKSLALIAIVGWLASLWLPALSFRFDGEHDQILEGYKVLTSGFYHLLVLELSWLTNFAFWFLAWGLLRWPERRKTIIVSAAITLLLAGQSIEIFIWDRFFQFPRAYPGYYLWVASIVALCVAAALTVTSTPGGRSSGPEVVR